MVNCRIAEHVGHLMLFTAGGLMGFYIYLLGVTHP